MKFKTKILQVGNNTGIEVPPVVIEKLAAGKKPPVVITLNKYTYRSTVAVMGGKYLVPLSKEHRTNAAVNGGDEIEINIRLDTAPREVEIPNVLKTLLAKNKKALLNFEKLAPSSKKKVVLLIESAKTEVTLQSRVTKLIATLETGGKV
jgi:uncharacterized protein DUF1905/bacteriocin resistance YdeI/OmpD-like protein